MVDRMTQSIKGNTIEFQSFDLSISQQDSYSI
jgi:hypothetical protein